MTSKASRTHVKVCGLTTVEDAVMCAEAGVDAIGLNFVAASPRFISRERARQIASAVGSRVLVVAVVADLEHHEIGPLLEETGARCVQFHGNESPDFVRAFLPHAYKAVRVAAETDVALASTFPGEHVLVDAKVPGALGGTGHSFDWMLVRGLASERHLTLAGGLTKDNVGHAVRLVSPYCVDVASGVESAPGRKDPALVAAFVRAARS